MKMANPAPVGTLSFGLSCLVIGALFAGWFGPMNSGNMFAGAISALSSGLLILIVTFLTLNKNSIADSPESRLHDCTGQGVECLITIAFP